MTLSLPGVGIHPLLSTLSLAADKAVSMHQGLCYRSLGPGTCTLPLAQRITKQICCCSRVGKAWGSQCEKCPVPGTGNLSFSCQLWPLGLFLVPSPKPAWVQTSFSQPGARILPVATVAMTSRVGWGGRAVTLAVTTVSQVVSLPLALQRPSGRSALPAMATPTPAQTFACP